MATIGTILIQAANQAGGITGSGTPSMAGMGAGGGEGVRDLKHQKLVEKQGAEANEQGAKAPKFWTAAFKKMGIQMGLAGILKQSQIFTSTIGSLFQIFGAFVDVMLAPFVPLFIPAIRWLARQLPTVAKAAQWTADKIHKGISAAWAFLSKVFSTGWMTNLATTIWDNVTEGWGNFIDFFKNLGSSLKTHLIDPLWTTIKEGLKTAWNSTLGGTRVPYIGWNIPNWGTGGGGGGGPDAAPPKPSKLEEAAEAGKNLGSRFLPQNWGSQHGDDFEGPGGKSKMKVVEDAAIAAGLAVAIGTGINLATKSVKLGSEAANAARLRKAFEMGDEGGDIAKTLKGKGLKVTRSGFFGAMDDFELNPVRALGGKVTAGIHQATKPLAAVPRLAVKATLGSGRTLAQAMGLMSGGVDDMAQAAAAGGPMRFGGPGTSGFADDLGQMNQRAPAFSDDLAQMKSKGPTKLSRAVNAFNQWVKKTTPKLKNAAGAGANAFKNVYDEGLSLADDVVKLAKVTPGMGVVGKIVSVGFKRVIPGIAGAYMVGETIQDVWKIVKSDAPWLGDWKSLDAYKAEAMGAIFGGGKLGLNPVGMLTGLFGKAQSALGLGDSISDWQDQIQKNQSEKGILSSGKLMDAIIRGGTGIGGAALSTFFPGLGTLAGAALYEGGRYATTGVNVPGLGQLGGDVDKYGPATDFSDTIIKAIESGFSRGVPFVEIR